MPRRKLNAADVAAKWARNLSSSGESIKAGVNAVTVAPGQAAADRKQQYVTGVANNAEKWAVRVKKVTLAQWKDAIISKGLSRIASGANAAKDKYGDFFKEFEGYLTDLDNTLAKMPRGDLQENIQRMIKAAEMAHEWGKKRKG